MSALVRIEKSRDPQRDLTGAGPEECAGRLDKVSEVDKRAEVGMRLLPDVIEAYVELEVPVAVANVAEECLAHIPEGDDATRDGDRLLIFSRLISRARFDPIESGDCLGRGVRTLRARRIGVKAAVAEGVRLLAADVLKV